MDMGPGMDMERLIGIVRGDGRLTARLVRQVVVPDFESPEAVAQAGDWFEVVERPLQALELHVYPRKVPLLDAWDALGQALPLSEEARAGVDLIMAETVLGSVSVEPGLPSAWELGGQEIRPAPTAAHPRAYRGTKYKPPRARGPAQMDLRPALCGTRRLGLLSVAQEERRAAEARLPEPFRVSLSPLVRAEVGMGTGELLALYWTLGLDRAPARLAAMAWLLSLQSGRGLGEWCRIVAALPDEHQTPVLGLLALSGAFGVDALALPAPLFAECLAEALGGPDRLYRAFWLLRGLTTGVAPEFLRAGYQLADRYEQSYEFHRVHQSGDFPFNAVVRWGEQCRAADGFYAGTLLSLWEQCGLHPGLGAWLETVDRAQYTPEVAWLCLRLYAETWDKWHELSEAQAEAKWQAVRPFLGAMEDLLGSVAPAWREKCVGHLTEYLWQWNTPGELKANLPPAFVLTRRLCGPPFAAKSDPTGVTTDFLAVLPPPLRARFLAAPDTCFRHLESACRRDNDTRLIARGTFTLTQAVPVFAVRAFESYPALLLKAAKLLGSLPAPVRASVTAPFCASPLFTGGLDALPLADVAAWLEAHRAPAVFDPVSARLRAHLAGTRMLAPTALAQASAQMRMQAVRAGLETVERAALQVLAKGFAVPAEPEQVRHALQIERGAQSNRRALRKFLRAYWDGQTDYLEEHPQTRQWLAAHPRLDRDLWRQGVAWAGETKAEGAVMLAAEQDPLEALKLGTYVGSCLGLGGHFTDSAAAVVLDLNKQVVYARSARGTVLARQVVALAEDDSLVCFSVYPLGAGPEMEALFGGYDRRLSVALGLPLHDPHGDEDYEIAHILSHYWWDDGAWDLGMDKGPAQAAPTKKRF